jgi:hypothetical protein
LSAWCCRYRTSLENERGEHAPWAEEYEQDRSFRFAVFATWMAKLSAVSAAISIPSDHHNPIPRSYLQVTGSL